MDAISEADGCDSNAISEARRQSHSSHSNDSSRVSSPDKAVSGNSSPEKVLSGETETDKRTERQTPGDAANGEEGSRGIGVSGGGVIAALEGPGDGPKQDASASGETVGGESLVDTVSRCFKEVAGRSTVPGGFVALADVMQSLVEAGVDEGVRSELEKAIVEKQAPQDEECGSEANWIQWSDVEQAMCSVVETPESPKCS